MRLIGIPGDPLVKVTLDTILTLKEQKLIEDDWRSGNKEPEYSPIALDLALATKAFDKARTILTRVQGVTGVLLAYVIRHVLEPEPEGADPPYRETDLDYTSINQGLIARSPILHNDEREQPPAAVAQTEINLEANGPFNLFFLTNSKKVWAILHPLFSASAVWQHAKRYSTTQNGCHVWHTLHTFFFGGDKVSSMHSDIIATLKNLFYSGDHMNYNFNRYCTAHMEQHN